MKTKLGTVALPLFICMLNLSLLFFPGDALAAAKDGLLIWFNNILPVMLPFSVFVNLLTALGFASFASALLDRFMRPLFGVPGCGAFALVAGAMSGYPIGAQAVAELRARNLICRAEGERLLMFSSNAGPMFIVGSVGAGMFGSSAFGYYLIAVLIFSALLTGLLVRILTVRSAAPDKRKPGSALSAFAQAAAKDPRPFGAKLAGSVQQAISTVLMVGAFVALFSVIVRILSVIGLLNPDGGIADLLIIGSIEMTLGISGLSGHGINMGVAAAVAAIAGFGGMSVLAQCLSAFAKTDLRATPYLIGKTLNALISVGVVLATFPFMPESAFAPDAQPAFSQSVGGQWLSGTVLAALTLAALAVMALLAAIVGAVRKNR